MSQSSPEGIILGKGSKLISAELSINKEKVFVIKQETMVEAKQGALAKNHFYQQKDWFEQFKKNK